MQVDSLGIWRKKQNDIYTTRVVLFDVPTDTLNVF